MGKNFNLMTSVAVAPSRNCRALFAVIVFLSLAVLSGCGGGWQPDRDMHHDEIRPGVDGSGLTGPADDLETHP